MNIILFLIATAGATFILVYGRIFKWLELTCALCTGFWVGSFLGLVFPDIGISLPGGGGVIASLFVFGPAGSIASYIVACLFNDDGLRLAIRPFHWKVSVAQD